MKFFKRRKKRKRYLEALPFFCEECHKFTWEFRNICENCGTKNTLRKATKKDYNKYID